VEPNQSGDTLAPFFFLSYAHTLNPKWVEKLYDDICNELIERTAWPLQAAGFMDRQVIPHGGDWRDEVAGALATCRVFVPLYSPRYFTRAECGIEWNAFSQRILDHRAREPSTPHPIVPALWTPVRDSDLPEVIRAVHANHGDFGEDYAREGLFTLIKNKLYRQSYVTAVQRLAQAIIKAAEVPLRPCSPSDLGQRNSAFESTDGSGPADRRVTVVVVAPTASRLPVECNEQFYGDSSVDWNPFFPHSRQPIGQYAAALARLYSYHPTVLPVENAIDFLAGSDPSNGLGLLLIDLWACRDEDLSRRLQALDDVDSGWVGAMVSWSSEDSRTKSCIVDLQGRLRKLMPRKLGDARPFAPANPWVSSMEQFSARMPEVLEGAMFRYINTVDAHPPAGSFPPRPQLSGLSEEDSTKTSESGLGETNDN
jgi:FxsC-like protein